jgi:predicted ATPase
MFKIEKITINNFKNIVDTEVPLGDFNVVVGPNNSGKSSFLQVIPFMRWLINGDLSKVESALINGIFTESISHIKNESRNENLKISLEYANLETRNVFSYELQLRSMRDGLGYLSIVNEGLYYKNRSATGKWIKIFDRTDSKVDFGRGFSQKGVFEQVQGHASVLRFLNLIGENLEGPKDYKEALKGLDEILNSPIFFFSPSELRKQRAYNP